MNHMNKVAVIGAGTMGNGIAHVFAMHKFKVNLIDLQQDQLSFALANISKNLDRMVQKNKISSEDKVAALVNIQTMSSLEQGVEAVDLVVEAISENEDLKLRLFAGLNTYTSKDCILATNTSSISITKLASVITNPSRVIGMHFMNPVPIMKLVEVIRAYQTSDQTSESIAEVCHLLDKIPIEVNDYPGFIANRILMPMINEAVYALYEGVGEVEAIDAIMKLGMAHPMGPLQLADFIGLDVCLSIMRVLYKGLGNPKYAPCPLLVNMVNAGKLGKKSREGFYLYEPGKPPTLAPLFR